MRFLVSAHMPQRTLERSRGVFPRTSVSIDLGNLGPKRDKGIPIFSGGADVVVPFRLTNAGHEYLQIGSRRNAWSVYIESQKA